jgi:hypothetical protein
MAKNMNCLRCLFTSDIAHIHDDGECEYCKMNDKLQAQSLPQDLMRVLDKIRKIGEKKKYDCLIGISGGLDSSTLLYLAVKSWDLHPLVIHFDNHWNAPEAIHNMKSLIQHLGVDAITYNVNKQEYDALNMAFLHAGVPDADIPNDIAMTKLMYDTANKYGIKYILNGHDFREEGSTPRGWTYMDAKYIQSVYKSYTGNDLVNYPLFTFWDQIKAGLRGIVQVRPFHYGFYRRGVEREMIQAIGWKSYGGKHCENVYTEFVGSYLLPVKFGIDKRIVYYSAQVRNGLMTKEDAICALHKKPDFDFTKFGDAADDIYKATLGDIGDRANYDRYNFKAWRPMIWLLMKMKVVPYTFYKKYCF